MANTATIETNIETYFEHLSLGTEIRKRTNEIINYVKLICPEPIAFIFISEYVDGEGKRVFQSLYCFTQNYMMEAKNFRSEYDIDMILLKSNIKYLQVKFEEYDLGVANEKSRMSLMIGLPNMVRAEFKATAENCNYLNLLITRFRSEIV